MTPCIRLVALLIAQGPHFYPSSSGVLQRRSLPSRAHVDHLRKSYPANPNAYISDGIATPKMGHYIQSRLISGSFLLPNDLCFNCDFRPEEFDWGNLIASSIFSADLPILTARSFLVSLGIRALFLESLQRVSTLSAVSSIRRIRDNIEERLAVLVLLNTNGIIEKRLKRD